MNNVYIALELMSVAILSILLYANVFETDHHTKRKKYFSNLLTVILILAIVDLMTWVDFDGERMVTLLKLAVSITYIFSFLIQLVFAEYLYVYISEKIETKKWPFISIRFYSILLCVITIYACVTGKMFNIENGAFYSGDFEIVYYILYLVSFLYLLLIILFNSKKLGLHDSLAALSFAALPLVSVVVSTFKGINLALPLMAIDSLIIYVMLESDKEDTLIYWSNYDELTGLFNRRAYEKDLQEMKKKEISSDLILLAADVNGLKQVNDNIGHDAGDEIIVGAAKALKNVFGEYGKVYRVGGDEFVAVFNAKENELNSLKDNLENEVNNFEGKIIESLSVSTGYATRKEYPDVTLEKLAKIADDRMYSDKSVYYQKSGFDRRSQKDAHKALYESYTKVLKINLTNDSFQVVEMSLDEKDEEKGYSDKISVWLKMFGETGNVHQDDLDEYYKKTDIAYIKNYFASGKKDLYIFYRRKYDNQFKNTMMEIVPAKDYKDDNQTMYLYVKRIDE